MDREIDAQHSSTELDPASLMEPELYPVTASREFLAIGEMAQEFGLTPRALRFYENKGLLSPQRRGAARLYGPAERRRLALVLRAKRLGFTLFEIRRMLEPPAEPGEGGALSISRRQCFDQIRHLEQRKREIESALAELRHTYSSFYARMVDATGQAAS